MPRSRPAPVTLTAEELLAAYPAEVRALAEQVRRVVRRAVPTFTERVLPGWKAIAFRDAQAGHVCALFPNPHEVRLYLEHGARLDDPDGLLEGSATMTRGRYVRIARPADLRPRALARLVRAAVTLQSL